MFFFFDKMSTELQEAIAPRFPSESWDLIDVVTPTVRDVKLDARFLSMHRIKTPMKRLH